MGAQGRSRIRPSYPGVVTWAIGNSNASAASWSADGTLLRFEQNKRGGRWPWQDCDWVLAGVVPSAVERLERILRRSQPGRVYRFRKDLPFLLCVRPSPQKCVGDDRLAAALGALAIDPRRPWVVIDAGTALTVNGVRPGGRKSEGRFEGGLIVPGEMLALRALAGGTAQLPRLTPWPAAIKTPALGRSTQAAIRAGVRRAQMAAAVALAKAQAQALGSGVRVAVTGGGAKALWPVLRKELRSFRPVWVPELVHRGLFEAWRRNARASSVSASKKDTDTALQADRI